MNFPILTFLTFFPLVGVIYILLRRGTDEVVERSSKNISILVSLINFIVSLFLWSKFDHNKSWLSICRRVGLD